MAQDALIQALRTFKDQRDWTYQKLADELGCSKTQLTSRFSGKTDFTLNEYIRALHLTHAASNLPFIGSLKAYVDDVFAHEAERT